MPRGGGSDWESGAGSLLALFGSEGSSRQPLGIPLCLSPSIAVSEDRGVCRRVHPPMYTADCVCLCVQQGSGSRGVAVYFEQPGSGCVDVRVCLGVRVYVGVWCCVSVSESVCMSVSVCVGGGVRFVAVSVRACVGCLCMYVCRGWVARTIPQTAVCKHFCSPARPPPAAEL